MTNDLKELNHGTDLCAVVKPLVWTWQRHCKDTSEARTQIGSWTVWEINGSAYCHGPRDTCGKSCGSNLEEAKAAAQADYEARILSAITIRSASDVAAEARAVAVEAAANAAYQWWDDEDAQELRDTIRALHDTDTLAAIDRIKEQARQEERERCAKIAEGFGCCHVTAKIAKAIMDGE